jgi:hypothetical protein
MASLQVHVGDTRAGLDSWQASCSPGTGGAPDLQYSVELGAEPIDLVARVIVDEDPDKPFDAVLSLRSTCSEAASELLCADFAWGEHIELLEHTGSVSLAVDGTAQFGGQSSGLFSLETRLRELRGEGQSCDPQGLESRCESGLRCSGGQCSTDSPAAQCAAATALGAGQTVDGQSFRYLADHLRGSCAYETDAGAGEVLYELTLPQTSDISISTDFPQTEFDTVLYLLDACEGSELACADDIDGQQGQLKSHLQVSALPAGSYFLVVDGASRAAPSGRFRLHLEVQPTP